MAWCCKVTTPSRCPQTLRWFLTCFLGHRHDSLGAGWQSNGADSCHGGVRLSVSGRRCLSLINSPNEWGGGGKTSRAGRNVHKFWLDVNGSVPRGIPLLSHETPDPLQGSDGCRQANTQDIPSMRCSFAYTWTEHVRRKIWQTHSYEMMSRICFFF